MNTSKTMIVLAEFSCRTNTRSAADSFAHRERKQHDKPVYSSRVVLASGEAVYRVFVHTGGNMRPANVYVLADRRGLSPEALDYLQEQREQSDARYPLPVNTWARKYAAHQRDLHARVHKALGE